MANHQSVINLLTATLILIVAFGFHWVGQSFSLLDWATAAKIGLQEEKLPADMKIYEYGIAVGDACLGWTYGIAAVGIFLHRPWGFRMAWFPGAILLYHTICFMAWTRGRMDAGYYFAIDHPGARYSWFIANLVTAILSIYTAWTHENMREHGGDYSRALLFRGVPTIAGTLVLVVGFLGHWLASLISLVNWDLAVRLGLQASGMTPEMKVYDYAFAVADVSIAWIYGIAGAGLLMNKSWGFQTAWFPGTILVYYSINFFAWSGGRIALGYDIDRGRYACFLSNIITGFLSLAVAWDNSTTTSYTPV